MSRLLREITLTNRSPLDCWPRVRVGVSGVVDQVMGDMVSSLPDCPSPQQQQTIPKQMEGALTCIETRTVNGRYVGGASKSSHTIVKDLPYVPVSQSTPVTVKVDVPLGIGHPPRDRSRPRPRVRSRDRRVAEQGTDCSPIRHRPNYMEDSESDGDQVYRPARGQYPPPDQTGQLQRAMATMCDYMMDRDQRPRFNPRARAPEYTGKTSNWSAYKLQFDIVARDAGRVTGDQKLTKLVASLKDAALVFYANLSSNVQTNFDRVCSEFNSRFGHGSKPRSVHQYLLKNMEQAPDEDIHTFADRVRNQVKAAGFHFSDVDPIAVDTFLSGVRDKASAALVAMKDPSSIEIALQNLELAATTTRKIPRIRSLMTGLNTSYESGVAAATANCRNTVVGQSQAPVAGQAKLSTDTLACLDSYFEKLLKAQEVSCQKLTDALTSRTGQRVSFADRGSPRNDPRPPTPPRQSSGGDSRNRDRNPQWDDRSRSPSPRNRGCFNCGKVGHYARDCHEALNDKGLGAQA